MKGACIEDLSGFMRVSSPEDKERNVVALEVVRELLEMCNEEGDGSRPSDELPFGVGYFNTLKDWVRGDLFLPSFDAGGAGSDLRSQAIQLVRTSLSSAVRIKGTKRAVERLGDSGETY